jgi:hypothetical protein
MEGERQRAPVEIRRMDDRLHVVRGMIWQAHKYDSSMLFG